MQIERASLVKLAGFGVAAAATIAAHPSEAATLAGAGLLLLGSVAHAGFGHLVLDFVHDVARRFDGAETARGVENRDLHRLIGETIAGVLEHEAGRTPGGKFGADYLKSAAAAFRGEAWMNAELIGPETALAEVNVRSFFSGDPEAIKEAPVLEHGEWVKLVEGIAKRPAVFAEFDAALNYAANELRKNFARKLWQSVKHAWEKGDLAWPALVLRLLSLTLGHADDAARNTTGLREEITALRNAVLEKAQPAIDNAKPSDQILIQAIREYQDQGVAAIRADIAELKAALANPRLAPVKERWINLPNTKKQILARDREAQLLLDALRAEGPAILSIAAPPGFGKTAVFSLALRVAFSHGDSPETQLNGIAVLDAKVDAPGIAAFSSLLGRVTGLQEAAARFASAAGASAGNGQENGARLRSLFFDFLRQAGKIWLVVENAETALAPRGASSPGASSPAREGGDLRDLLKDWCKHDHEARLLMLTRHAPHPSPEGYRGLRRIEEALLGGLPAPAAVELLRQRLEDTRFGETAESLLLQTVQKLHRVPMAIEQFGSYLRQREQGIELNQRFLEDNDLLRLKNPEQLLGIVAQNLDLLDPPSLDLLRLVAWAAMPVPQSGLMAYRPDADQLLTRLVRSNQLLPLEGTAAEGRSFDMHPLIREALSERPGDGLDFARIREVFLDAGNAERNQTQFRPALALYTLEERAAREVGERGSLATAIGSRGNAFSDLGRLEEAIVAHDESIAILREAVEKEHQWELRNHLAASIMNRGITLGDLDRPEEALSGFDESIAIYRGLMEKEHRRELRSNLANAIVNRGNALRNLNRLEEAVAAHDKSIELYRELVEREHRRDLRNDLATAIMNRGAVLKDLGRLEEALAADDESVAIRRDLVERERRRELRNELAMSIMGRGSVLADLGRLEEAVMAYAESLPIYRELVEKEHRLELRNNLALTLYNLALARERQSALPAALESARGARRILQDSVNDGMKYLEPWLARAENLEARLLNRLS